MVELSINLFTDIMTMAIPIAIVFEIGNLIVSTFMRTAFGGKLWFGAK